MKNFIYIIVVLLVIGCKSQKPIIEDVKRTVTDSTVTKITYEPVKQKIVVPGDTVTFDIPFYKLSEKPIYAQSESGRTTASVRLENDQLEVTCLTETYEQIIEMQNKIIENLTTRLEKTEQLQTVTETKVPLVVKILAWIGGAFALLFLGAVLIKIFKPF